jgi:hypothetical protein
MMRTIFNVKTFVHLRYAARYQKFFSCLFITRPDSNRQAREEQKRAKVAVKVAINSTNSFPIERGTLEKLLFIALSPIAFPYSTHPKAN